jgi:hypothetical protein
VVVDPENLGKLIDQWKGLLAGIAALLVAIIGVHKALTDPDWRTWSWPEIAVAAVAILLLAIVTIRSRKAHVSRLIDPDALKLDPQSPDQLVGRREHLDKLLRALTNPLVFLVSESGCGKSALLRAGVAQGPAFTQRFLPIYIDMSALDWEDGPLRAVREEFAQALPNDDPARSTLDAHSTSRQYAETFGDYYRRTQRRPLLLLDQFDDYQAQPRHRERFLPPETRVWRNAETIARENAFWRMLRQCLHSDSVSIVVACRGDAAQGLDSVRFHPDVPQFDLPRLERGLVRLIIDRLTVRPADKPAVIVKPQGGWMALRDRLVDDLEARGQVLPQQLKVALGGLRTLPRLTPAAYASAGRLAGLEAAFVAGAITSAARTAALRDEEVLRLLLPLIDGTRQPPDKGPAQPQIQLAENAGVPENTSKQALESLETDEIVRPRSDLQDATIAWQLDHAYLAPPILHIERERDQWHRLLVERARAYAEASWRGKWSALLPLVVQTRLVGARLQRRFRYGEQRRYALKSLARATPALATVAVIAGLIWAATEWDAARQIEGRMAGIGDPMSDDAAAALTDLAGRSWVARWQVARDIFASPQDAQWFAAAPGPVVRAWARLDPNRLDDLVQSHVTPEALQQSDHRLKAAADALIRETSLAALTDTTRIAFERTVGGALADPATASSAASILPGALTEGDSRASQWLTGLREAIGNTDDADQLNTPAQAYRAVAGKLKEGDPHAAEELTAVRTAISKTTNSDQLRAWAQAYSAVSGKLKEGDPHAAEELTALRTAIGKTTNSDQLRAWAQAYSAVSGKLKEGDPHAAEELTALRTAFGNTDDADQLSTLAQAYAALADKLKEGDPHAAEVLAGLRKAIGNTDDADQLSGLARAYAAVASKLREGDPHAAEVLHGLRKAMGNSDDPSQLSGLAQAYAAVASRLKKSDSHTAEVLVGLGEAVGDTPIPGELADALAQVSAALASNLTESDDHTAEELADLRDDMSDSAQPFQLSGLVQVYATIASKLKEGDPHAAEELAGLRKTLRKSMAGDMATEMLQDFSQLSGTRMEADPDAAALRSYLLSPLGKIYAAAFAAVAGKLNEGDPHAAEALAKLREAVGGSKNFYQLSAWAQVYAAVASKRKEGDPHVAEVLARLHDATGMTTDSYQLSALAQAYVGVTHWLNETGSYAPEVLARLREAIGKTTDVDELSALAQAYVAVAGKLEEADAHAAEELAALREAIGKITHPDQLSALAQAYAEVAKRARPATAPVKDIAVLLSRMGDLRSQNQDKAFAAAILAALRLGSPPLTWDKAGLVVTAALLQPISAGKPTRQLVQGYEDLVRQRSDFPKLEKSWSGDVWAFASWAHENLPGFDSHQPKVGFLPSVAQGAHD